MFQGSLFGDAQVGVDQSFAQLTPPSPRRALLDRLRPRLAGRRRRHVRRPRRDPRLETAHGDDVRTAAPRATADRRGGPNGVGVEPLPVLGDGPPGAECPLRRALRHDRIQLVSRWRRLGGVARRPPRAAARRGEHRHRQRRRPAPVPPAAARRAADRSPTSSATAICLVMGGACQHHWQHAVPKAAGAGARISITFRHSGVS